MSPSILHTSDWHLGKKLFRKSRINEQRDFLNWLAEYIESNSIEILIIAGDIFDTPTPPNEALDLYFDFLEKVSLNTEKHIIIISGNHDSANFIQAPAKILKKHNIHIKTRLSKDLEDNLINLNIKDTPISFFALPYFRSYELYDFLDKDQVLDEKSVQKIMTDFSQYKSCDPDFKEAHKVLVAHHAFGDFSATGSEHIINIMGLESLKLEWFKNDFDYIALGHIHKTQKMSKTHEIYYSGSPIPMRFSEKQAKHCLHYNIDSNTTTKIEIPSFKEIVSLEASEGEVIEKVQELIKTLKAQNAIEAFIEIKLHLANPNTSLIDELYSLVNAHNHKLLSLIPIYQNEANTQEKSVNINELNINDLFDHYYLEKYPQIESVPIEIKKEFQKILEEKNDEIS